MKLNADNKALPGVMVERTIAEGKELHRADVFQHGQYIGQVVYVTRRTVRGTLYGWRPAKAAAQSKLTTRTDAIKRLPKYVP